MSPNATTIEEEGVYIDNFKLVDRGRFREQALYDLLNGARYPARNALQNVNDMKAQIAANEKGVQELRKMVAHFTLPVVKAYMQHVQDNAAESVRRVIDRLHDCVVRLRDGPGHLHQGAASASTRTSARRPSTSPAPRRSSRPISTRPSR